VSQLPAILSKRVTGSSFIGIARVSSVSADGDTAKVFLSDEETMVEVPVSELTVVPPAMVRNRDLGDESDGGTA
jgi:hypothetical protein